MDNWLVSPRKVHPVIHKDQKGRQLRGTYIQNNNIPAIFPSDTELGKDIQGPKTKRCQSS